MKSKLYLRRSKTMCVVLLSLVSVLIAQLSESSIFLRSPRVLSNAGPDTETLATSGTILAEFEQVTEKFVILHGSDAK